MSFSFLVLKVILPIPVARYIRSAHKLYKGPTPNMDKLKKEVNTTLLPIHFDINNDLTYGPYLYDKYFRGIICSPKFEGKSAKEIHCMMEEVYKKCGLDGFCRFRCQPPSQFYKLRRCIRKHKSLDV